MQTEDTHTELSGRELIHALRSRSHADILEELRALLAPFLEESCIRESPAPLVLRLLQIRLKNGVLRNVLDLHRHPQIHEHHAEVQWILEDHDADHLEWVERVIECIEDATDELR